MFTNEFLRNRKTQAPNISVIEYKHIIHHSDFFPQNDALSQNITKNMYHDSQKTYAYFSFDYQRISAAARKTIYFTAL